MTEPQNITIDLAFTNVDERQPDPATVGDVARQAVGNLRGQGYTVQPAYTGAKGGDVFTIAAQLGQNIIDNKDLLIALIGLATPVVTVLLDRYGKQQDKGDTPAASQHQEPPQPVTISIIINQATALVEAADLDDHERLLQKLLHAQPDLIETVTPETRPAIVVRVPRKQQRRKR